MDHTNYYNEWQRALSRSNKATARLRGLSRPSKEGDSLLQAKEAQIQAEVKWLEERKNKVDAEAAEKKAKLDQRLTRLKVDLIDLMDGVKRRQDEAFVEARDASIEQGRAKTAWEEDKRSREQERERAGKTKEDSYGTVQHMNEVLARLKLKQPKILNLDEKQT